MTSQVHQFLKFKVREMLSELGIQSGIEIVVNNANLERIGFMIEEYLGLDKFNELDHAMEVVNEYE